MDASIKTALREASALVNKGIIGQETSARARFWLPLGAVVLLLAFLLYSTTFRNLIEAANGWAEAVMNAPPVTGALVFFLFSAASAMLAFASSAVLVPSANLVWGKFVTFLLLWGGYQRKP